LEENFRSIVSFRTESDLSRGHPARPEQEETRFEERRSFAFASQGIRINGYGLAIYTIRWAGLLPATGRGWVQPAGVLNLPYLDMPAWLTQRKAPDSSQAGRRQDELPLDEIETCRDGECPIWNACAN
jgi:hypothetical protein